MRLLATVVLSGALLSGCGGPKQREEWRPDGAERQYLEQWAGRIARSLVPPGDPAQLDAGGIRRLMARCDSVPQRYVYLWQRVSDSVQAATAPEPGCVRKEGVVDPPQEDSTEAVR